MSLALTGFRAWLVQRISALYMAGYLIYLISVLFAAAPIDFAAWRALFAELWFQLASMVFFTLLLLHAWIGMRDVVLDYVGGAGNRLAVLMLVAMVLGIEFFWFAAVLLEVPA